MPGLGIHVNSSHQVGIYDSSGNLLASATVDNSSTASNGYLYTSLGSPLLLTSGNYSIAGTTLGLNDGWIYQADNLVTDPNITYLDSWYSSGNGGELSFPTNDTLGGLARCRSREQGCCWVWACVVLQFCGAGK